MPADLLDPETAHNVTAHDEILNNPQGAFKKRMALREAASKAFHEVRHHRRARWSDYSSRWKLSLFDFCSCTFTALLLVLLLPLVLLLLLVHLYKQLLVLQLIQEILL